MIARTERAMRFQAVNLLLKDAGYVVFGRPLSRPDQIYARFVVACNTIGEMMSVHPYRVYQSILMRVERIVRDSPHNPKNSGYVRAGRHQDAEDLHVFCPCCGADLLTAGAPTKEEIVRDVMAKSGQLPQKSPHSREDEGKSLHTIGKRKEETGTVAGAGGTGGGDPAGAGRPND